MCDVFRMNNEMILVIFGMGSVGMEVCVCNFVELGDEMLVCINGVFGGCMKDVVECYGVVVYLFEIEWG